MLSVSDYYLIPLGLLLGARIHEIGLLVALLVVLLFGCLPAWLPIAVATASPRHGRAALRAFGDFVTRHGRRLALSLTVLLGGYLVVRGLFGLG